jgi:hypothetical protein
LKEFIVVSWALTETGYKMNDVDRRSLSQIYIIYVQSQWLGNSRQFPKPVFCLWNLKIVFKLGVSWVHYFCDSETTWQRPLFFSLNLELIDYLITTYTISIYNNLYKLIIGSYPVRIGRHIIGSLNFQCLHLTNEQLRLRKTRTSFLKSVCLDNLWD